MKLRVIRVPVLILVAHLVCCRTANAETEMMVATSYLRTPVDVDPVHLPTKSPYSLLARRYEAGRGMKPEDLKGWYTGRCFFKDSPARPVASALIADTNRESLANGPAFSAPEYRHITPLFDLTSKPNKFDVIERPLFKEIQRVLSKSAPLNDYPVSSNDELVIAGHRTLDLQARAYKIRRDGDYSILRLECAENSYCSNQSSWVSNHFLAYEGEAVAYCYYFRKVRK